MTIEETASYLILNHILISQLETEEKDVITSNLKPITLRKGNVFSSKNRVLFIFSGIVRSDYITENDSVFIELNGPNEIVGFWNLGNRERFEIRYTAFYDKVDGFTIDKMVLEKVFSNNLTIYTSFLRNEFESSISILLKERMKESVNQRLLFFLNEIAKKAGRETPEGRRITIRLKQREIAEFTGFSRQTITNALKYLVIENKIKYNKKEITILKIK